MDERWDGLERQAREWAAEQLGRLADFLRAATPAIEEAAERAIEFLREELPAAQRALTDAVAELADRVGADQDPAAPAQLEPGDPLGHYELAEQDEARKGIAELEDFLRDR